MTILYMNREYNVMRLAYSRADREYLELKNDYEKLYDAYYSYNKKIAGILHTNHNVYWSKDSTTYLIVNDTNVFFSFYKKPRMDKEMHLWVTNPSGEPMDLGKINELKPHQFLSFKRKKEQHQIFIAPTAYPQPDSANADKPDPALWLFELP